MFLKKNQAYRYLLYIMIAMTLLGLGHHADHYFRDSYLGIPEGWPFAAQFTPYSYSLVVYLLILLGFYLETKRKQIALYWFFFLSASFIGIAIQDLGPIKIQPPLDIITTYPNRLFGTLAFLDLAGFLVLSFFGAIYAMKLYLGFRKTKS